MVQKDSLSVLLLFLHELCFSGFRFQRKAHCLAVQGHISENCAVVIQCRNFPCRQQRARAEECLKMPVIDRNRIASQLSVQFFAASACLKLTNQLRPSSR